MSVQFAVASEIEEMAACLHVGDFDGYRAARRRMSETVDPRSLHIMHKVAEVLQNRPRAAVAVLRDWWQHAPTDADRALIAACVPTKQEQRERAQQRAAQGDRAPKWNGRNNYQAPSTVETRQGARQRRRSRQEAADVAAFQSYQAERAGVAEGDQIMERDERTRAEQVYASGFDYDRAALYGTDVALRCLSCMISRGRYDLDRARLQAGHGDDGLCADCRESGQPGIPPLPAGHSPADEITARCAFITASLPAAGARVMLRNEWTNAPTRTVQAAIAAYVAAELPAPPPAEPHAEMGTCRSCEHPRAIRDLRGVTTDDQMCAECRADHATLADCALCDESRDAADMEGRTWDDEMCAECRAQYVAA